MRFILLIAMVVAACSPATQIKPKFQTPIELLEKLYNQNQVLAIGESNHSHYESYDLLVALLQKVGTDPSLKYIATESPYKLKELFAKKSIGEWNEAPFLYQDFIGYEYYEKKLFPVIRQINKQRRRDNPLIVLGIDGLPMSTVPKNLQDERYANSWDRENNTKENFEREILPSINKGQKAIVFYHLFHLVQGLKAEFPKLNKTGTAWETKEDLSNWLSMVYRDLPRLRDKTAIVVIDETERSWARNGTFVLGSALAKEQNYRPFGVEIREVKSKSLETGQRIFCPGTMAERFKIYYGDVGIEDLADALIWFPEAKNKDYRNLSE